MKHPAVIDVHPQDNFILHLVFANGENGLLDMKPYLEIGIFSRIKHPESFTKVKVSFDTIEWESGADLDPEFVYSKCQEINRAVKENA